MSIQVNHLSFSYGSGEILKDISFNVKEGHLLSVLGSNGAGKSTLFRCILGLLRDYTGEVLINNNNVATMGPKEIARQIAYIPQSHYQSFNYSVFDMVIMGTLFQIPAFYAPGKAQEDFAMASLEKLGICDLAERNYSQLSGGEQQLVFI
ncbi:MAG: ABC transporter ATP-binding protein, partial [Clostridiales bacterium]